MKPPRALFHDALLMGSSICSVSTLMNPWSVMAHAGNAARQMNDRNINGMEMMQPRSAHAAFNALFFAASLARKVGKQAAQGIFDAFNDLTAVDEALSAANFDKMVHGNRHVLEVRAHNNDVVVAVPTDEAMAPLRHMEAAHKRLAHVTVLAITFNLRDIEHVLIDIACHAAVDAGKLHLARLRWNPRQRVHTGGLHTRGASGAARS